MTEALVAIEEIRAHAHGEAVYSGFSRDWERSRAGWRRDCSILREAAEVIARMAEEDHLTSEERCTLAELWKQLEKESDSLETLATLDVRPTEFINRRKPELDFLVSRSMELWCRITGDDRATLRVGHPDTPGPFMTFLIAAAEPWLEIGRLSVNSLHLKARQQLGRRS